MQTRTAYSEVLQKDISKAFTIADDVEVKGAELKDGLLKIQWKESNEGSQDLN